MKLPRRSIRTTGVPIDRKLLAATAIVAVLGVLGLGGGATAHALDAAPWDRVAQRFAKPGGFDYAGLKADPVAMADLAAFVTAVGSMPESEPLSSWLNAYNAIVVKAVVDRYPLRSVRDVPGFFDRIRYRVAGQDRTLDAIENQIIRPRFRDARVHVALNCGARSCPPIFNRAFREASLSQTLDQIARRIVASDNHVRFRSGRLEVSSIFVWFRDDFARDAGSVLGWIRRYDQTGRFAAVPAGAAQTERPYDWRLNDASRSPAPVGPSRPGPPS